MSRIGATIISDSGTVNNDGQYMVIKLCLVVCPRLVLTTTTILAAGFVVQKFFASILGLLKGWKRTGFLPGKCTIKRSVNKRVMLQLKYYL